MSSRVNTEYQFADSFKAVYKFRDAICVFNNISFKSLMTNLTTQSKDNSNV